VALPSLSPGQENSLAPEAAKGLVEQINSLSGLVFQLAAERYMSNTNRGESWILTVHSGTNVLKYEDAHHILVSLPALTPRDKIGLCQYASAYNSLVECEMDNLVKRGVFEKPLETFQELVQFDRCGERSRLAEKLRLVRKLAKENSEETMKQFSQLSNEMFVRFDYSQLRTAKPQSVKSLKSLSLPD
jgi:hypothetical protein